MDRDITILLERAEAGEAHAANELLPLVYAQLRRAAEIALRDERPGHTLQATALVHDAFVRMVGENPVGWSGRAHFYHAAARAMRQLLVEHARARGRIKRGGDGTPGSAPKRVPLGVADLAEEGDPGEILALDEAMSHLEAIDPEAAAVVRLRFYAGLSGEQAAQALGISPRQVDRLWAYARAALFERVSRERGVDGAADRHSNS
ncbi:MAG: ECF-type sigma factor [Phycisphaerales bacterium]